MFNGGTLQPIPALTDHEFQVAEFLTSDATREKRSGVNMAAYFES